ncbi:ABC transporter substrate-binding protein [Burkholderia sp. FERM BP-3421]|uniref:ABC transporter substrate-binding protein n=1 Tax=Burkholderia sp. FERM BP-3421 TaxID=1494466 RepID=UPI002361123F|nr:ABC transporter substrate-binding protein [Burkholderia sp. FERM BP-3421]WDD94507.1 ABC transporter substrate-binding protein [Burkholderia sp. FERM BP-3421]
MSTEFSPPRRALLRCAPATALLMSVPRAWGARASAPVIEDIAGRRVHFARPVRRLLLGDGALAYALPLLRPDAPFANVVAWGANFRAADLDSYRAYQRRFPAIAGIPTFPDSTLEAVSAELAISLAPDAVLLNLSSRPAAESSGLVAHLAEAGIPVLYVDFRTRLFANAARSMRILGELLDCRARAEAFLRFRQAQIDRVTTRLARRDARPLVMVERAAGLYGDCCLSYGNGSFGELVGAAGGTNLGTAFLHGHFGTLHPEQVIASDPDVVLVTGANWSLYAPAGDWVNLGPGADPAEGRARLGRLMARPGYRTLRAVRNGRVYAIWHAFYDNPYHFIALQRLATWLHPQRFADLDPDATFRELHERFLPVPYQPGYWLGPEAAPPSAHA